MEKDERVPESATRRGQDTEPLSVSESNAKEASSPLVSAAFCVEGDDLVPGVFTAELEIQPSSSDDSSRHTGWLVPSGEDFYRKPFWCIEIPKSGSFDIDDQIACLLDILWPKRAVFRALQRSLTFESAFVANVTIYGGRPVYHLSYETMARMAYFRSKFLLDILDLSG